MTGDIHSDADDLNLISNIFKKINRGLEGSCLYLDFTLAMDRSCFIDIIFHINSDSRWIRVDVSELLSYKAISFVNSSSYDYLAILSKYYPILREITKRVKDNHEFDMTHAARNASPQWATVNVLRNRPESEATKMDL
jgi:hypothetical protein